MNIDNDGTKLIWRDEKNKTIEISENVTKYLNIQSYSRVEQDQYVRFNYRNGTRSTGYDSNYKNGEYLFGCRFCNLSFI